MVEGVLEKQAHLSYTKWLELAKKQIQSLEIETTKIQPSDSPPQQDKRNELILNNSELVPSSSNSGFVRMRLSTYKRVVSGTEKLAQMLSSTSLHQFTPPENVIFSASLDNTPLDVVVQGHDDSDLKIMENTDERKMPEREKSRVERRKWKGKMMLFAFIATLFIIFLWFTIIMRKEEQEQE